MKITVHRATSRDIPDIQQFIRSMWSETYAQVLCQHTLENEVDSWLEPRLLAAQIDNQDCFFGIVRDDGGKVIGITTVGKLDDTTLMVGRLYVHPYYQGQGIAKKMLDTAVATFRGVRKIQVDVEEKNYKAINFYEREGFSKTRTKPEEIGDTIFYVVVMEKQASQDGECCDDVQ